ncbi:MAG: methyltransferase domain-containing protein [Burkholderiales bacterium]
MKAVVQDYEVVAPLPQGNFAFHGDSAAEKRLIFHAVPDVQRPVEVLDIGFGLGTLGALVKRNAETSHWQVDGIDGFEVACCNAGLFEQKLYRNVWHGYAQDLPAERLASYDVLCLLDVIEHLDADGARALLKSLLGALRDDGVLLISTPLWFYPQDSNQAGDLEEHLIGVPASSMMALQPLMYAMGPSLVGTFAYSKQSLEYADLFHPVTDKSFSIEQGAKVAAAVGMRLQPGVVYKAATH